MTLVLTCPLTGEDYAGHCPACHKPVLYSKEGDDGPVWTCPANLSEGNPHRVPAPDWITEEICEREGVFSNCVSDFRPFDSRRVPCEHEDMPLHAACYNADNVTW